MTILAIETSCDETAVAIIESQKKNKQKIKVIGNALFSQTKIHEPLGGVVPSLARREHEKNLVPLIEKALMEGDLLKFSKNKKNPDKKLLNKIRKILHREYTLSEKLLSFVQNLQKPKIDAIAVTCGPGLEPALWVGINFAKALGVIWNIPVFPINHMEGHIMSSLIKPIGKNNYKIIPPKLPLLALLISGGHTELVLMKKWLSYKIIGETVDDAVGEAFDKVARMLKLPYPGGPQISKLSEEARNKNIQSEIKLPRPMLQSGNCNFSFSGLKTSVLYSLKKLEKGGSAQKIQDQEISYEDKVKFAKEFEDAVGDVLLLKTERAIKETGAKTLVLGGGVSANTHIRRVFSNEIENNLKGVKLLIPSQSLSTDNAIMIGLSAFLRIKIKKPLNRIGSKEKSRGLSATGNLRLF